MNKRHDALVNYRENRTALMNLRVMAPARYLFSVGDTGTAYLKPGGAEKVS